MSFAILRIEFHQTVICTQLFLPKWSLLQLWVCRFPQELHFAFTCYAGFLLWHHLSGGMFNPRPIAARLHICYCLMPQPHADFISTADIILVFLQRSMFIQGSKKHFINQLRLSKASSLPSTTLGPGPAIFSFLTQQLIA